MTVPELIQLMRLSGTDKVRAYLTQEEKLAATFGPSRCFLAQLEEMFLKCKRDSVAEAWPPMFETALCNPQQQSAPAAASPDSSTTQSIQTPATP